MLLIGLAFLAFALLVGLLEVGVVTSALVVGGVFIVVALLRGERSL